MRALSAASLIVLTGLLSSTGIPEAAASGPPATDRAESSDPDSTGALEAALEWGVGSMIGEYPELRVAVLDAWGPRERARQADDLELSGPVDRTQKRVEAAAGILRMPVVLDDTFDSIWQACSGNPHAEACVRHSGEGSLEVRHLTKMDDGSFEASLGLRIVLGGRDLNSGFQQGVTVAVEPAGGG